MSRSSGTQTQTTTSEPPSYLKPFLQQAATSAQQQFQSGGTPVVGFSPDSIMAMHRARVRSTQGSPVANAAENFAVQTLNGGMMGQNPFLAGGENPFLEETFNRAADAVTNRVQTNFGRAGRNVRGADAAGVASMHMNDLASQIFGNAYESDANRRLAAFTNERQLQQGILPFVGSMAADDFADIGALANVGAQKEALQREQVGAPGRNLDEFISRLMGFPGGTVTQSIPMERNGLAGALGGAQMGSMFGPWGMLGGAILGGLL